ncbi:MAG: aminotransferase class I/II-fold pyridoxal phosphate-dependent enzyme, partial [Gammaproteobacteria bacterium]|nr:aminotransferase class I/II-fold pyridoxal phosphate-dependent enzyme [Gammaproteobacteria bacterium]
YCKPHQQLEEAFATFLNREEALLFNSGYHANIGVIATFANRNSTILADKFCHASLIDGIILSRAKHYRFKHNDSEDAKQIIKKISQQAKPNHLLLITESIFSIHGDMGNITEMIKIAEKNNAMLVIDDAHGVGVLGENGKGICEHYPLTQREVPCLITPLGKALGSFGAIVSGKKNSLEPLLQFARTLHYSTALPPAICDATRAALNILQNESWRRKKLQALIQFFIKTCVQRQLPLISLDETPIKAFAINSNQHALMIQKNLSTKNLLIACIRPPTVSPQTVCLRICLNAEHTEKQIVYLLDCLQEQYDALSRK